MGGKPKGPKVLTAKEQEKKDAEARKKAIESMWKACKNDKGGDAEKAIKAGFPIDYADEDFGHTALHRAAAFGSVAVLRVLRKAGASLETKNNAKETALDTAKALNNELAAKLLEAFAEGKTGDDIGQDEEDDGSDGEETPREEAAAADAGPATTDGKALEAYPTAEAAEAKTAAVEPLAAVMEAVAVE